MTTLAGDLRTPDSTAVVSGEISLTATRQRAVGSTTLVRITYRLEVVNSTYSKTDIPAGEYDVLEHLEDDEGTRGTELAYRVVVPASGTWTLRALRDMYDGPPAADRDLYVTAEIADATYVRSVNDVEPDDGGNVVITAGSSTVDGLTDAGAAGKSVVRAIDAAAVRTAAGAAAVSHTHTPAQIADLTEYVQDTAAALIRGGTNVTVAYDDAAGTFTINSTGGTGGGTTDPEIVRDVIGGALVGSTGIQITVNDAADTLTFAVANIPQSEVTGLVAALAARYTKTESDSRFPAKREVFGHSLAGASTGMALPSVSASGHPLTWTQNPGSVANTGKINGRGAFWTSPSASGPTATYMTASLVNKPRWGRMRFLILPQTTLNGTACIAAPSKADIGGTLTMGPHFWSTRFHWAMTVWDGGQQILDEGDYDTPLGADAVRPLEFELAFAITGSTIRFRTADGVERVLTDSRIASLGGNFLFAESYDPAATDDIIGITSLDGGDTPPEWLFASPSTADIQQRIGRPVRTVNGQAPNAAGDVTVAGGGSGGADSRFTVTEHTIGDGTTAGPYVITHNQGTRSVDVTGYRLLPPSETLAGLVVERPSKNAIVIRTDTPIPRSQIVIRGVVGTSDVTAPTAPTVSSAAKTTTSIDVTATGATDASGISAYNYWRGGTYVGTAAVGATFQHTGLTPGTDYVLTATAVDGVGNESAQSSPITVKTSAAAPNVARISNVRSRTTGAGTAAAAITPAAGSNKYLIAFVTLSHSAWQSEASLDVKTVSDSIDGAWTKLAVAEYGTEQTGQLWLFAKPAPTQLGTARTVTANCGKSGMGNAHLIIDVIEFDNVASLGTPVTNAKNNSTLTAVSVTVPTTVGNATAAVLIGSDGNALSPASGTAFIANTSNGEMDGTFDQAALCSTASTSSSTTYASANTKYATAAVGVDLVRAL